MFKTCINCKRGSKILKELYLYRTEGEISPKSVIFEEEISEEERKEFLEYCMVSIANVKSKKEEFNQKEEVEKRIKDSLIATEILRFFAYLPEELGAKRRKEIFEKWVKNIKSVYKIEELKEFIPEYFGNDDIKKFMDDVNRLRRISCADEAEFLKRLETECIRIAEYEKDLKLDDMCLFEAINIINALDVVLHKGIFKKKMDKIPDKEISELYEDLLESRKEFREVLSELNEFNARNQKPYAVKNTRAVLNLMGDKNSHNKELKIKKKVIKFVLEIIKKYFVLVDSEETTLVNDTQASCFLKALKEKIRNDEAEKERKSTEKERESTEMNKIYEAERFVRRMHELPIEDLNYIKRYLKEAPKKFDVCLARVLEYRKMNHNQLAKRLGITLSSLKSMITSENSKKLDKYIDEIYKILRIDSDVLKKGYGKAYDVSSDHEKGCWIEKDFIRSKVEREIPKYEETKNLSQEEIEEYVDSMRYYYLKDKDNAELVLHLMETK